MSDIMKVILYQPQIPQNTGNVVRTCAVTGTDLILVGPLGFSISNRWLKRAGLDYWEGVDVSLIEDLVEYLDSQSSPFFIFFPVRPVLFIHLHPMELMTS